MPKPAHTSREYLIYLAIWRKAIKSSEPIVIKCSSRNMAISMRQGMYRAMRPYREGTLIDDQLKRAAEKFVIYLSPKEEAEATLTLRERLTLGELDNLLDELGIDESDLIASDDQAANASLEEFLKKQDNQPSRSTPFYKRENLV